MPPWVGLLLRVGGTAGLMAFALRSVEWPQLFSLLRTIDWAWWLAALGVALCVHTIAALRWAALARPIGFPLPTSVFIRRFFEGAFFSLCLPSSIGGDVIKAYRLSDSTSGRLLAGCTVLADRLAGLTALGVLAGTALAATEWSLPWFQTLLVGAGLLLAAWLPMRLGIASLPRLAGAFSEGHPAKRFIAQLLPYSEQPGLLTHAFFWSLLVQVGSTLTVVLVGKSLGVTLSLLTWFAVVPLVALAMVLPITVSGVGRADPGGDRANRRRALPARSQSPLHHQADIHQQQLAVCGNTRPWPVPVPDNHSLLPRGPVDHPPTLRRRASSSIRAATVFAS